MNEELRPDDFGEPQVFVKYLKNKIFKNRSL